MDTHGQLTDLIRYDGDRHATMWEVEFIESMAVREANGQMLTDKMITKIDDIWERLLG